MLSPRDRARLQEAGVDADVLDAVSVHPSQDPRLPAWWHDLGNRLHLAEGAKVPDAVVAHLGLIAFRDALVVIGSDLSTLSSLLIGGDGATVFIGARCELTSGALYCGGGSSIVLEGPLVATRQAVIDARNGGTIVVAPDQLWAADVYVATDDMHRLEDRRTRARLNPFGAHIRIGRHVWLCKDAVVTGHVEIGDGAVVGLRAMVRGQKVPAHCVVAGVPARVVRDDVHWTYEDSP